LHINTKAYGGLEIDERQKITFPAGLLGFEECREWALLDSDKPPFFWLQSLESRDLAFILIDPFTFRPDFALSADGSELRAIGAAGPADALIFAIVTIPPGGALMTANLQGPLVINRETRTGLQAILSDPRWQTRHDIRAELAAARKAPC
jgi:flagellar assembly factor FliW